MKSISKTCLAAVASIFTLGACSSDPSPEISSDTSTALVRTPVTSDPAGGAGGDIGALRQSASDALANKDTSGARASAEKALDKHVPGDKRTELLDKATDAARKKAKELGKEEDLDKVRNALDNFLKKKDS